MVKKLLLALVVMALAAYLLPGCGGRSPRFTVTEIQGQLQVKGTDEQSWRVLKTGDQIKTGSLIRTGAGASGTVLVDDNSKLYVAPDSEIEVETLKGETADYVISFKLKRGDTFYYLESGTRKFYVITPMAVMGIIGTGFRVTVDDDGTHARVAVAEGTVSVKKDNAEVLLPAGFALDIDRNQPLGSPTPIFMPQELFNGEPVNRLLGKTKPGPAIEIPIRRPSPDDETGLPPSSPKKMLTCPACQSKVEESKFCFYCKSPLAPGAGK